MKYLLFSSMPREITYSISSYFSQCDARVHLKVNNNKNKILLFCNFPHSMKKSHTHKYTHTHTHTRTYTHKECKIIFFAIYRLPLKVRSSQTEMKYVKESMLLNAHNVLNQFLPKQIFVPRVSIFLITKQ